MNLIGKYPSHTHVTEFYLGQTVYLYSDLNQPMTITMLWLEINRMFATYKEGDIAYTLFFTPEMLISEEDIEMVRQEKLLIVCTN
jgi:hypothetical protein